MSYGKDFISFDGARLPTKKIHGTGCVFATALTAMLARGSDIKAAVRQAKDTTREAIKNAYLIRGSFYNARPGGSS